MLGGSGVLSSLVSPITHRVTPVIPIFHLLTKSPHDPPSGIDHRVRSLGNGDMEAITYLGSV